MQCVYRKLCKDYFHYQKADECTHEESLECPMAFKIQDMLMDAEDIENEYEDEDEVPFCEPYDGPEEEFEI